MSPAAHPLPLEGVQGWERALGKREHEPQAARRAPGADQLARGVLIGLLAAANVMRAFCHPPSLGKGRSL